MHAQVTDIIMPLIAAIYGGYPQFNDLYFTVNRSKFLISDFINQVRRWVQHMSLTDVTQSLHLHLFLWGCMCTLVESMQLFKVS
jgi:large-conductance mechanosensitive channel